MKIKLKGLEPWVEILNEIELSISIHMYLFQMLQICEQESRNLLALVFACAKWDEKSIVDLDNWTTCALCVLSQDIEDVNTELCFTCVLNKARQGCVMGDDTLYKKYRRYPTDENRQAMQDFLIKLYKEEYERVVK